MRKSDARGMQEIALEQRQISSPRAQTARRAVERVAHNRMPDGRKVRANLVRAPRMEHGLNQRAAVQPRDHSPIGPRVTPLATARCHARPPMRIARNGKSDRAGIARHLAVHQRQINFPDIARTKLLADIFMRLVIPRHDHGARRYPCPGDERCPDATHRPCRRVCPGDTAAH